MPEPPQTQVAAIVLAAGKSTRMKSRTPKALHSLLGRSLLGWVLAAVKDSGVQRTILVVGHQAEQIRVAMGAGYEYAVQAELSGTGRAVQSAEALLSDWRGTLLVLPGDAPLISSALLRSLVDEHTRSGAAATLLTATIEESGAYGRVVRDPATGNVQKIVEARDATPEQLEIREINTSVYAFDPAKLFAALRQITPQNAQGEYYLTDVIALLSGQGEIVVSAVSNDADIVRGVNNRAELVELAKMLQERVHRGHLLDGVTILDPLTTFIEAAVKIGQDTVIHPFTVLSGVTDIGDDCVIGPGARITDSQIGNGVSVRDSYVVASTVGDGTKVGPFAHLRPGSVVGKDAKIGNFVELKNTIMGDHVSAGHLAYLGDSEIGAGTNIGAGTITCNYDPFRAPTKNKTMIGREAFVGSNSTLVAPVSVGDGAYTAAGSVITDPVPTDALGIGRARQVNKDGWAAEKRKAALKEIVSKAGG